MLLVWRQASMEWMALDQAAPAPLADEVVGWVG